MSVEVDTLELEVFEVSPQPLSRTRRTEVARNIRRKKKRSRSRRVNEDRTRGNAECSTIVSPARF